MPSGLHGRRDMTSMPADEVLHKNLVLQTCLFSTKSEYVSPACGFKKLYENVKEELTTPNPVTKLELNQTQIINEDKTHLYLVF